MAQLLATLAEEYDAPGDVLENDILKLLEELQSEDLILETSGPARRRCSSPGWLTLVILF